MKVYIKAKSKKALNERIANGETIKGVSYNPWGGEVHTLRDLPTGTVVAVFEKMLSGAPYAKTWGQWNQEKNLVK